MKTVQLITKQSAIMYLLTGILVFGWFGTIARGAPRVVGGHDAPNHKYPHIVSLRDLSDGRHFCGGSILNEYWILTAAHCVADRTTYGYKISVGTNYLNESGDVYLPEFTIVHESYQSFWYHDIALIRVAGTLIFHKNVQPVNLTKIDLENYNRPATFAGWGSVRYGGSMTKSLQEIFLEVIDMEKCKRYQNRVDDSHLCSFTRVNEGACMGDSGSPLLVDGVQIGIASYVTPCGIGQPDVFTRVYAYKDWIDTTMEPSEGQTKIVGGAAAEDGQFPYQVSLRLGNRHFCGASIIEKRWILTAAHCLASFNDTAITVVAGTNTLDEGGDRYQSVKTISHAKYSSLLIRNDIGLIKVDRDIVYSDKVKPIAVASENFKKCDYPAVLSGWGKTEHPGKIPNKLQFLNLTVIDQRECLNTSFRVTDNNLCTLNKEGEGACHGDSGGPLVADDVQIGVVSWGRPCAKGRPDVFTRVYSYKDWIEKHTAD